MFGRTDYTLTSDLWSLGCVLFEIANKRVLFEGSTNRDCLRMMVNYLKSPTNADLLGMNENRNIELTFAPKSWSLKKSFKSFCPNGFIQIIKGLLKWNPKSRLTLQEILDHDFLNPKSN